MSVDIINTPLFLRCLEDGIRDYLVGNLTELQWSTTGYTTDDEAKVYTLQSLIAPTPSRALQITAGTGPTNPQPGYNLIEARVQLLYRGTPDRTATLEWLGEPYGVLHEQSGLALGRVRASFILGGDVAYLGADSNGRHRYSQNYLVRSSGQVSPVGP